MRKLMWFTAGFAAGCAAGAYLGCGFWLWVVAAVFLAAGVLLYFLPLTSTGKRIIGLLAAGIAFGCIFISVQDGTQLAKARQYDGKTVTATIELTDFGAPTKTGISAEGNITLDGTRYALRVFLSVITAVNPGDSFSGEFTLYFTGTGGSMESSYLQSSGIHFQAFPKDALTYISAEGQNIKFLPQYLRNNVLKLLDKLFPEDTAGFAKALLLGDSSDLSAEVDTAFRNSGIRHIIAVSGLHVSILFSMVSLLTGKRRWLTAMLGIPVLILFAAVAGFTPSVTRACIMQGLILIAMALDQEYDPPTALSVSVLVLLAIDPMTVTSVSFQLSVGCVLGIFLLYTPIHNFLLKAKWMNGGKGKGLKAKLIRWFTGSVAISTSALAFTLPLSAVHFRSICLVGVISNLLTLWAVTWIFYGIILSCICGSIWLPIGNFLAWAISWLMRYVSAAALWLGKLPFAYIPADNIYIIAWLVFLYVVLIALALSKRKPVALMAGCLALCFAISVITTVVESRRDAFRVTVLDVGQGQCVLLQSQDHCYMVDCGGSAAKATADSAVRALWNQGIYRLDGIILTHYDEDHTNGLLPLFVQIESDCLYLPQTKDRDKLRPQLESAFTGEEIAVDEIISVPCGLGTITIIPPLIGTTGNESSLCILFQAENCDILITGDRTITGEEQLLRQYPLPDIEILIVGHHGSGNSTGLELLRRLKPEIAAISVGQDNLYGHPEQETLDRLNLFGCKIYRTDEQGTITFRR
jgi:competence protein ComEC